MENSSSKMKIRSATTEDEPAVRELVFSILESYELEPSPQGTDADLYDFKRYYFDRGGDFSVMMDQDQIIGTVAILNEGNRVCELRKMYLDSRYRRRGLGRQLMEYGLAKARELGFRRVTLETATALKEAVTLYESYGFKRVQSERQAPRCDISMALDLEDLGA